MKKGIKILGIVALVLVTSFAMASCSGSDDDDVSGRYYLESNRQYSFEFLNGGIVGVRMYEVIYNGTYFVSGITVTVNFNDEEEFFTIVDSRTLLDSQHRYWRK